MLKNEIGDVLLNFRLLGLTIKDGEDAILALIDRQRCVWTGNDYGGYKTSCGKFIYRSKPNYCENCGCKVEVKDEAN